MDNQLKSNLLSSKHWIRVVYMVFFAVCVQVSRIVMWAVIGFQFLFMLLSGKDNPKLRAFGQSLTDYIYQSLKFLTYNSEEKPFPFADWPSAPVQEELETPLEGEVEVAHEDTSESKVAGEGSAEVVEENTPEAQPENKEPQSETEAEKQSDDERLETDKV